MHTSEQAKSLWCPMARVAQSGETDTQAAYNRTLSRQLMPLKLSVVQHPGNFELGETPAAEQHTEIVLKLFSAVSQAAKCIGDECACWRWATNGNYEHDCAVTGTKLGETVVPAGFCGLAGRMSDIEDENFPAFNAAARALDMPVLTLAEAVIEAPQRVETREPAHA